MLKRMLLWIAGALARRYGFGLYDPDKVNRARLLATDLFVFVNDTSGHFTNGYKGVRRVLRDLAEINRTLDGCDTLPVYEPKKVA